MKINFKSIRTEADMVQVLQSLLPIGQATLSDVTELLEANGAPYGSITLSQIYNSSHKNPSIDPEIIDYVIDALFIARYPWWLRLWLLRFGIFKVGFSVLFFFSNEILVEVNARIQTVGP